MYGETSFTAPAPTHKKIGKRLKNIDKKSLKNMSFVAAGHLDYVNVY